MTPFQTLTALRNTYPTPMSNDQLGLLLNAVAWHHRGEGYGLLKKPSGANCPQPQTGFRISRDILMQPDGTIYDVLIDAEGDATPTWGKKKPIQDRTRWIAPVDALAVVLPPTPPVEPKPPVTHAQPYPDENTWWEQFLEEIEKLYIQKGETLNRGLFKWSARTAYDIGAGMEKDAAKAKHLAELKAQFGL